MIYLACIPTIEISSIQQNNISIQQNTRNMNSTSSNAIRNHKNTRNIFSYRDLSFNTLELIYVYIYINLYI